MHDPEDSKYPASHDRHSTWDALAKATWQVKQGLGQVSHALLVALANKYREEQEAKHWSP